MPTNVRTDNKDLVTQYARGTVLQPADPVFLKPKGDPGVAPHFNISTSIKNAAGTVFDHKTQVAHSESYMGQGKHAPIVMRGQKTGMLDGDNGFLSYMKNVYIEGRNAVMHGVETGVNAAWNMVPAAVKTAVDNASKIAGGMTPEHFGDAAKDEAQAMLDALASKDTLIALAQTAALMGISAIPVVGQIAGGAAVVMRIKSAVESAAGAAEELKAMVDRWSQPMSPAQLEEERKKLASFLIRVGIAIILAALGKALAKLSGKASGRENSSKEVKVGEKEKPKETGCLCSIGNPVIIATGEKSLTHNDFSLPGMIALDWIRKYRSGDVRESWFGQGWSVAVAVNLNITADAVVYHDAVGRQVRLPFIAVGESLFDAYEQFTLRRPQYDHWEMTFKDGRSEHFHRARNDLFILPLQTISDRNGNRVSFQYPEVPDDPFQPWLPTGLTDSAGRQLHFRWNAQDRLTAVTLRAEAGTPLQTLAKYHYDEQGNLISHRDAGGAQRSYEWRNHLLTGYTLPDGARYVADYDEYSPAGRVTRSYAAADGNGHHFDYDPRQRATRVTDALGRCTTYLHDERKDIIATIGPDGVRTDTPFDANGHPRGNTDPLGRQTHYRFDQRGNLLELVDPAGARTAIRYNELDLPVQFTDALGHSWQREYDSLGNLLASTDPLQHITRYQNNTQGLPVTITDARGGRKHLEWDNAGNLLSYTDCSGQTSRFSYDSAGRLLTRSNALGQRADYEWDNAGRLVSVTEADGSVHRYQWSPEGRLQSYTDPLGAETRYHYNNSGDPIQRTDANGHTLHYHYDSVGRLIQLLNENNDSTRFTYNLADQLTDEQGFDGRHQRYCYNAAGELTHLVEAGGSDAGPGKVTRFERDPLGRLTTRSNDSATHDDASDETSYRYDLLGRLTEANNPAARIAFAYDPLGQLLSETQTTAHGPAQILQHRYDELGNRIQTTLPDQRTLHWLFYGSGHLHQINLEENGQHQLISDIDRDPLHREIQRSQGQLQSHYDYDPMGRLTRHQTRRTATSGSTGYHSQPTVDTERSYRYDAAGNLTGIRDSLRGAQHYRYDPTGRILAATGRQEELFAFDPAGNLLNHAQNQTAQKAPTPQAVRGNRLSVYQDIRHEYDPDGNLTHRRKGTHEETRLQWNAAHQLQSATVTRHGVTQTTRYQYDALGRRTGKTDAFGHTRYLWDGDLMIQSQRGNKAALYLYEAVSFIPLATVQNGQTYWYQCDQIGTPQELTDAEGQIVWAADYKVWGEAKLRKLTQRTGTYDQHYDPFEWQTTTLAQTPIEQPFRFQGQQFDEETGLHYNRFRYYDPAVGRFISQDPIGLLGGMNSFAYGPNPMGWLDPFGLEKRMSVRDSGHHAPAVRKSKGRPFEMARSNKCWPTIFPKGDDPEHDHWKLHEAERNHVGPRQGDFKGSDTELFDAYEKAYKDKSLKGMKVDLRSPDGTVTLAENVSPLTAMKRMRAWVKEKGLLCG